MYVKETVDNGVKGFLKGNERTSESKPGLFGEAYQFSLDTDLLQAQSDPYRRMSANLYETKSRGQFYHIHGSLEASTTLRMIGLEPFRPDLRGDHARIVETIGARVKKHTIGELEDLNARNRQAGIPVFTHEEFIQTPHVCQSLHTMPLGLGFNM